MKKVDQSSRQGWIETVGHGLLKRLVLLAMGAACCAVLLRPLPGQAAMMGSHAITQLDFIKFLVELAGDQGYFGPGATDRDFVYWAKKYKIKPREGIQPNAPLTRDVMAQMIVDWFRLKGDKSTGKDDAIAILEREGINVPGIRHDQVMTWNDAVDIADEPPFQTRLNVFSHNTCSPIVGKKHKITIKKCTPPPTQKRPKVKTVKSPKSIKSKSKSQKP
jgi:hypothetical protein